MKATDTPAIAMRRWTRAEYDRLIELGVFQSDERLELLDGWLVLREPQGTGHSAAIRRVLAVLRPALGEEWQIDSQLPVAVDDRSEREPNHSLDAHARAGVPESWIVDLPPATLEVHREPEASDLLP